MGGTGARRCSRGGGDQTVGIAAGGVRRTKEGEGFSRCGA